MFDRQTALKRLGNSQSLFDAMVQFFCEDYPPHLYALRSAIERKSGIDIASSAHAIKGLAGNLDAHTVVALALQIEQAGKRGDLEAAEDRFPAFEKELEKLKQALELYLRTESQKSSVK